MVNTDAVNEDHSPFSLVTAPLLGLNYLKWSTSVQISLGAKDKLSYIDGSINKPNEASSDFAKWRKKDFLVRSWILGSLTKELEESFLYCFTARDMWKRLEVRFGVANGPQVFKIQREINMIDQGNTELAVYLNKLSKLWEDLNKVQLIPFCECERCTCNVNTRLSNLDVSIKVVQFLMRLNDSCEIVKNQVLMQDPLPDVDKTYSMLQTIEALIP